MPHHVKVSRATVEELFVLEKEDAKPNGLQYDVATDRLLVADVDQQFVNKTKGRTDPDGNGHSTGQHQRKQTHRLHRHRFPTRVRTGNDEHVIVDAEVQVESDHRALGRPFLDRSIAES